MVHGQGKAGPSLGDFGWKAAALGIQKELEGPQPNRGVTAFKSTRHPKQGGQIAYNRKLPEKPTQPMQRGSGRGLRRSGRVNRHIRRRGRRLVTTSCIKACTAMLVK